MQVTAKGQITIIDTNDGRALSSILTANHPTTQIYTSGIAESFTPNWEHYDSTKNQYDNELVIKPEIFASGYTTNQIGRCKNFHWKIDGTYINEAGQNASLNETYGAIVETLDGHPTCVGGQLRIRKNMAGALMTIECEFVFVDPDTLIDTATKATLQFVKVNNAGDSICAIMYAPYGNTVYTEFGDDVSGKPTVANSLDSVTLRCDMWRGSAIDNTDVRHVWYFMDSADNTWKNINEAIRTESTAISRLSNKFKLYDSVTNQALGKTDLATGKKYLADTLVVGADAIDDFLMIKCEIEDLDSSVATSGKTVSDTITVYDATDSYSVQIETDKGDRLTTNVTSTNLKATVWNNGEPMSEGFHNNLVRYDWEAVDKNGNNLPGWKDLKEKNAYNQDVAINPKDDDGNISTRQIKVTKDMFQFRATFSCTCKIGFYIDSKLKNTDKVSQGAADKPSVIAKTDF